MKTSPNLRCVDHSHGRINPLRNHSIVRVNLQTGGQLGQSINAMTDIVLRDARYSELPEIAHVMARAFWHDNLFGDLIHPHREAYPDDMDLYWLRRSRVSFWNWRWRFLVAVSKNEEGKEVIAGVAQWARLGDGGRNMDLYTLDPRKLNSSI